MINADLLLETLTFIDRNRTDWHQGFWRCCFAGHAAILAGGRWAIPDPDHTLARLLKPVPDDRRQDVLVYGAPDGWDGPPLHGVSVRTRAVRLIGLDELQARRLFDATNTLPRLYTIVSDLCEEAAA
ncbi:hypothetical protein [Nonomuraea sp. NPDC049750]|uniref:hypothetical protein n=1 Tax=Nonomuraea sp. NPDC049750 TaxID=3154738 RepID=UPI0033E58C3C